jgi:hypothetical protein
VLSAGGVTRGQKNIAPRVSIGGWGEFHLGRGARLVREAAATLRIQDENTGNESFHVDVYGVIGLGLASL